MSNTTDTDEGEPTSDEKTETKTLLEIEEDTSTKGSENLSLDTTTPSPRQVNLCDFLLAYFGLLVLNRPKTVLGVVIGVLLGLIILVNATLSNPDVSVSSIIETDYSYVMSKYDLSMGKIDHWCLRGGDENCRCEDPLNPSSKKDLPPWNEAHDLNKNSIDEFMNSTYGAIDVVFLGENIAEEWAGRVLANTVPEQHDGSQTFEKRFKRKEGGKYNGLTLGIARDTAPNVLWRIQNGEMPKELNPSVWWLIVGTNDLARQQCSEEIVLLGILRLIEEIQENKPDVKIVVNSILPITSDVDGAVPNIEKTTKNQPVKKGPKGGKKQRRRALKIFRTRPNKGKQIPTKTYRTGVFRKKKAVELWPSVVAINERLRQFCEKHKKIIFFDATDIFVDRTDEVPKIDKSLMMSLITGVPTKEGHDALQKGVVRKLDSIFAKLQQKKEKKQMNKDAGGD